MDRPHACPKVRGVGDLADPRHSLMAFGVEGQVVGSGEPAAALLAPEGFGARVLAVVSRQLVRPGEAPLAALPRALVRLFTCGRRWKIIDS